MKKKRAKQARGIKASRIGGNTGRKEMFKSSHPEVVDHGKAKKNLPLILTICLLLILVLVTYQGAFDNSFVDWDDYTYVVENDLVRNTKETTLKDVFSELVSLNYHPLTILSLRLNNNTCKTCMDGISPAPFIRWNIIIHMLNTLLVFWFIYLLSKKKILAAFLVAAIFGVHPMHVESVAWISERKDVLYTFFFLSGLITYLKFESVSNSDKRKYVWLLATFLLFVLSCLSKAMAVVFPMVLILIKFWIYQPAGSNPVKESVREALSFKNLVPLIPFFLFSLFWGIMAISINNLNTFTFWHRIQFASYGLIMYIVKFFVPVNLAAIYPYPTLSEYESSTFGTILMLAPFAFLLITGLVIFSLKRSKLIFFGIGFFLITVIMVSQFISVGVAIMADRYSYLCYIGLAFIPAMMIGDKVTKNRIPLYITTGFFVLFMMVLARKQIEVWSNSDTLWTREIELYPKQEGPRSIRGLYYSKIAKLTDDPDKKVLYEKKAFEDFKFAIKAGSKRADVFEGVGCLYGKYGDYTNALDFLTKAINLKPEKGSSYFNRGLTFSMLNKYDEAISDYNMAMKYSPENAVEILTNRSNMLLETGRFSEAVADFDYLISVDQRNFLFYYNRAFAKQQTNDIPGAISDYQRALQLQPDDQMTGMQLQKLLPATK